MKKVYFDLEESLDYATILPNPSFTRTADIQRRKAASLDRSFVKDLRSNYHLSNFALFFSLLLFLLLSLLLALLHSLLLSILLSLLLSILLSILLFLCSFYALSIALSIALIIALNNAPSMSIFYFLSSVAFSFLCLLAFLCDFLHFFLFCYYLFILLFL